MFRQLRALLISVTLVFLLMVGPTFAEDQTNIGVTGNSSTQVSCALLETMLGGAGISLQSFNVSEQSFNLSEQSFNLSEQSFNLSEQNFNISEQNFNISEQTFNVSEQNFNVSEQNFNVSEQYFNVSEQNFNLAEQTFNLSEQTFNLSEQGFTVSEQGFNLSEQGFNVSEQNFNVSEQELFTWYAPVFEWIGETDTQVLPFSVLMDYSRAENVAAEVALHNAPATWGADLMANAGVTTGDTTSLHGTVPVAVIFVDVGDVNDSSTHMSKVVGVFNQLAVAANFDYYPVYIDISQPNISYRVSKGIDPSDGVYYDGIQGALETEVDALLNMDTPVTNIVINMSLAFIPCADENITTESGYTFDWDIDDFVQEYENSLDPNYVPPQDEVAVKPVAECVYTDGKNWFARFGFENNNIDPVWLEAGGNKNRFSPSPQYRDQPSIFETGRHRGVIEIKFSKPSITWELIDQFGMQQMATAYIPGDEPATMGPRDTVTNCLDLEAWEHPAGAAIDPNTGGLMPPTEPIQPILECIRYDETGANPVAVFGYENFNKRTVYVPSGGKDNKFSPNPGNRGQVTHFLPGRQPSVFEVPFKDNEQNISWTLESSGWFSGTVDFPTTIVAEAYPATPLNCAETYNNATDAGNYLATFMNVPENEVLNVLTYLLTTKTLDDDDTNLQGLRSLLATYLEGSQANPSPYNIVAIAASGNYRPWFNIMLAEANAKIVNGANGESYIQFLDDHITPLAPARWPETIAVSASLGKDAWAIMDDDNNNAYVDDTTGEFHSQTVPEDGDGVVNPWEDEAYGEDIDFQWMRWFFSHDGDIMVRGAGYNAGTAENPHSIAGTSFASPGAAFVLAEYFSFPDACTFPTVDGKVYPPIRQIVPTGWDNRVMEEPYGDGATPLWCDVETNEAPIANDDSYTVLEDGYVVVNAPGVLANDDDDDKATLKVVAVNTTTDEGGSIEILENGTVYYTAPDPVMYPNFDGTDSFVYTVVDKYGATATATVTFTVSDITIIIDPTNPDEGGSVSITVVVTDPNGGQPDVDITVEEDGQVILSSPNGEPVVYTPPENFCGDVTLEITVTVTMDGQTSTSVQTITLHFTCVNDAPVAQGQSVVTDEDTPLGITLTATDVENDPLTFTIASNPLHGSLTGEGAVLSYSPNLNYHGADAFTFEVCDTPDVGLIVECSQAVVNITINSVNDDPVAVDDIASTNEDTAVTIAVLANDNDDADGDILSVAAVGTASNGAVVLNGDNTVSYTPNANYNGSDSFMYSISDGNGGSAVATVYITVNAVNDDPVAVDDIASTNEDTAVTIAVLANDSDSADGDVLSVATVGTASNGAVVLNGDNTVSYTPNANYYGSDSFAYTISDGNGGSATASVYITVNSVNDNPVAVDDIASTNEDTAVTIAVLANDNDDADGDILSVAAVGTASNGTVELNNDNTVTYTPNADYNGQDSFMYSISDGNGGSAVATVYITVIAVNDPPSCPVSATASPSVIPNPVNHKLLPVTITLYPSDVDSNVEIVVESVYIVQDEPYNGTGDGNTGDDFPYDAKVLSVDNTNLIIYTELRSERAGNRNGRVYTIYFTITDGEFPCASYVKVPVGEDAIDDLDEYPPQ